MTISVPIPAKNLSIEQLVGIYNQFCRAYDFEPNESDDAYLRIQGIRNLNSGSTLDYRPMMGAKFFATGDSTHTEFWGYTSDKRQPRRARNFEKLVTEFLGKNQQI